MLWDGVEWVPHQGVVPQGEKDVIGAHGIWATADHEILTEHGWREWSEVSTNRSLFRSAIDKANSPLPTGCYTINPAENLRGGTPLLDVRVGGKGKLTGTISKLAELLGAISALNYLVQKLGNGIGGMKISSLKNITELGYLTGYLHAFRGVTIQNLNVLS